MNFIIKILALFVLLFQIESTAFGQSPLSLLPAGIILGETTNTAVESKGVCVLKVTYRDTVTHCAKFSMLDDKFFAYATPNDVINKISFLSVMHHSLPLNWQNIGLRLASSYRYQKIKSKNEINNVTIENEGGNLQPEFLTIIAANGATNITLQKTYKSDYQIGEMISFNVGRLHFEAEFIKWVKPTWCTKCPSYTDYDNGLVSIEVTESYDN